jgi:hypothetical protein
VNVGSGDYVSMLTREGIREPGGEGFRALAWFAACAEGTEASYAGDRVASRIYVLRHVSSSTLR